MFFPFHRIILKLRQGSCHDPWRTCMVHEDPHWKLWSQGMPVHAGGVHIACPFFTWGQKGLLNIQPASHPPGAVTASHLPEPTSSLLTLSVFAAAQHPSLVTAAPPSRVDYAVYIAPAWVSWATWVAWDAQATCAAATIHSTSIYHIFVHSSQPSISRKILNLQSFRANRTQVSVPCWG